MKLSEILTDTFKALRHELGHDRPRAPRPMWLQRLSADSDFCRAVVEAEKTAVIMSEVKPQYLWLAAGGLYELTADKLFPLRHHRVVLFPDTDPDLQAYTRWYHVAQEARRLYGCNVSVSPLLEQRATPEQKQRKIDLVDYMLEVKSEK